MLKKRVTYIDYNGVQQTEDFYFHLKPSELAELEVSVEGGYSELLEKAKNEDNHQVLYKFVKDVLTKSYGIKSEDGKRFIKNDELVEAFEQSPAYDEIFMEVISNPENFNAFVDAVTPNMNKLAQPTFSLA